MTDLVNLAVFGTLVEAELAKIYLETEGIYVVVSGAIAFGYEGGRPRLMVLDDDLDEARKLLGEYLAKEDARSGRGQSQRR